MTAGLKVLFQGFQISLQIFSMQNAMYSSVILPNFFFLQTVNTENTTQKIVATVSPALHSDL